MHPTKVAAILALVIALVSAGYFCVVLYQNVVLHKTEFAAYASIERKMETGEDDGFEDNSTEQYLISGGIAAVGLITSLALFGAAKDKK